MKDVRDPIALGNLLDEQPAGFGDDAAYPGRERLRELYRTMLVARSVDDVEAEMTSGGEAAFHVSGSGHEGSAVLGLSLIPEDWLHLHYRDKALILARGVPPVMFFHSLICNGASHSAGRQMSAHMSDPSRRLLSTVGPVGNNALQAVGVASRIKGDPERPLVVCAMGEGTTQQGEVLEAIAEAVRSELPVLFWVEDNGLAISTKTTRKTFYSLPDWCGEIETFHGLPIHRLNGRDVAQAAGPVEAIVEQIRRTRCPGLVVFEVDRLADHTNSDDERVYRPREEIQRVRRQADPILVLGDHLVRAGVPRRELDQLAEQVEAEVRQAADLARRAVDPKVALDAKKPLPPELTGAEREYRGDPGDPRLTMLEAVREVLRARLADDPRASLYGQDIEDPKGDVFGITKGLTVAFPGRVVNSPLTESTIMGMAIGQALAGGRPVAFIQFADFLPLAFNQIISELGSMYWRTDGGWQCPVVVMAPCGGYRPGLGPFHAQTLESVLAHVPGVDVVMPSHAADAAGLLNAAFASDRPTIYLYPKVYLNDRDVLTSGDVQRQFVPLGKARFVTRGDDLTLVTWGATVRLCQKAVEHLAGVGVGVDLIDLRSISPWDKEAVLESARRTGRVVVVHEDNMTCGFGAEVLAAVAEEAGRPVACKRVTRPDTYVPCNFSNQLEVLPSVRRILEASAGLLDLDFSWELPIQGESDLFVVEAIGASPADQSVTVVDWLVAPGEEIRAGQKIAELESDKSVFDLASPAGGVVDSLLISEGDTVRVGTPLARVRLGGSTARKGQVREEPGVPRLRRRAAAAPAVRKAQKNERVVATSVEVGMSRAYAVAGSVDFHNRDIVKLFPKRTPEELTRRFGIESRHRLAEDETVLTMAVRAAEEALRGEGLSIGDIDLVVCSTNTPIFTVPSLACLILNALATEEKSDTAAYDITAACTGYLYGLASGYDYLQTRPSGRVLVVTAEAMSRISDPKDLFTTTHYGDAASATVLSGQNLAAGRWGRLRRPVIGAKGEDGTILRVELEGEGRVVMDGKQALAAAVPAMAEMLTRACREAGLRPGDLDMLIPHQGSTAMIDELRNALGLDAARVYNNIKVHGNTSSSSIPLCLSELADRGGLSGKIGLAAFGGGFTFGGAVVTRD